jgi:imidazolonepropionase-like amidohydrolase
MFASPDALNANCDRLALRAPQTVTCPFSREGGHLTTLTGLRIWDGVADGYVEGSRLTFDNGLIVAGNGGEQRDLSGLTAIPGLIDAHVHMVLDPELRDALSHGKLEPDAELAAMAARAKGMVAAGITTARDLGGGRHLELVLRDRIRSGELAGPRLVCAGQPVTCPGGHCHFWGGESADFEAARQVIARQAEHGVDLIKVMATGGSMTPGSRPKDSQFDAATLAAIVREANARGYDVAAHCHGTEGIGFAVAAGVRTIEHCSWVGAEGWGVAYDPQVAAALVAAGIWVSPTINAGWRRFLGRGDAFETRVKANFAAMRTAGVRFAASTDAGIPNVRHADLGKALPVFAEFAGLSTVAALRAATSDCAQAIGLGAETGTLAPGYAADVVFFEGDPLADLSCLAAPVGVMARGEWMLEPN